MTRAQMRKLRIPLILTMICGLLAPPPAFGQPATVKWYIERFTYFYRDPRPERLQGLIEKWQSDTGNRWDPYPPLVGFLAVVFRNRPDWIGRLIPPKLTPGSATALVGALRLAGDPPIPAEVRSRIAQAGSDEILKNQLAGLPNRLIDLRITLPTHLDIFWGAALASGDERYVLKIIDFFAQTANQSNQVALDITTTAATMPRDSQGLGRSLRSKYGDRGYVKLVFAATALWALTSNAKQHPFVKQTMFKYGLTHRRTPAAIAILLCTLRN